MISAEPVAIGRLASAALLGGTIVLLGACYSIFLALARLGNFRWANAAAYASYAAMAACVIAFAALLELRGFWLVLIAFMLVGYFTLPRFIWRLSSAVHEGEEEEGEEGHGGAPAAVPAPSVPGRE